MKPIVSQECLDLLFKHLHEVHSASADRCDWNNCSEIGVFDGLNIVLLNAEVRKNLKGDSRFVFLCPKHFILATVNIKLDEE